MKKTVILLLLLMLTLSLASNVVMAANDSLLDDQGVTSIDDLKDKANKGAVAVIWFLRLGGIVLLAIAFFQMYLNPDTGKRAVIFAIIGTMGIVLAPQIVNGFNAFFS
jgi:hypothetical protein